MFIQTRKRKLNCPFSSFPSNSFLLFSLHFPVNLNCQTKWKRKKPTPLEDPVSEAPSSSTPPHGGDYEGGHEQQKGNNYEVFLSFRGKDTRKGFTDHLYIGLVDAGIQVFRDDNDLRVGEEIGPELLCSITQSAISIPIISENYASSKWCLRELAQMLKCKKSGGQIVLPIFYKVEPSQLRHLTGRFEDAINAHRENLDKKVVKEWEDALKEAGSLKGWESENIDHGHEGALVKIVVREVMNKLKRTFQLIVPHQLVGTDDRIEEIMSLIDDKFNGTRIIGLYGMGGIGKTTLAKVLYNKLFTHFEYRSFVANIRETSQRKGIECVQNKLICDIIGSSCHVSDVDEGIGVIKSRFTSKKVLILLDDMDDNTHVNALVGDSSWFGAGSIVIITTRAESIFNEAWTCYKYPVNELSKDQSLILFSRHAFRKDFPHSDYAVISHDVVYTTGGLPLALEIIGSFLCGKKGEVWKDTLNKLKKVPDKKVQEKLKISYEALDYEEQQIFLDIACFFIGSCKQNPTYMWDACSFHPSKGIEVLRLMSLIKIDEDGILVMHDQLRDLGREIVRLENPKEPQERSRLWNYEEARDVLDNNKGTRKMEALSLGNCGMERRYGTRSVEKRYTAEQFKEMSNLRFLQVEGANFTGDFQSLLPKLGWLEWVDCPTDFAAANFHPKNLAVLNLSGSAISEDWGGWVPLKMATKLKVLNLTGCGFLKRTPDLSAFESLEILILQDCADLEEIHPSIGNIETLFSLDVSGCESLEELPTGIGRMKKLRELHLDGTCIQEIPISGDCLMKLKTLTLRGCELSQLPKSMGSLVSLTLLNLSCLAIEELPESIGSMKKLKSLYANDCSLLAHIRNSIGDLASLQHLILDRCSSLTEIPDSIGKLASLTKLNLQFTSITKLPKSIGNMQNLRELNISCTAITKLPDDIGMLAKLQVLEASSCDNLEQLPSNIDDLVSLEKLKVGYCLKLRELPELPSGLTTLEFCCQRSPRHHLSQLTRLEKLTLSHCPWLERLPELPIGLSMLDIIGCKKLKALTNLSSLKHLSQLHLNGCFDLTEVIGLEGSHHLSNFHAKHCPKISGIEDSWKVMSMDEYMPDLFDPKIPQGTNAASQCACMGQLLDFSSFKCLTSLIIYYCNDIAEIQVLESLTYLEIGHCPLLRSVDLSNLKNQCHLRFSDCKSLVEIRGLEELEHLPNTQIYIFGCPSLRHSLGQRRRGIRIE